MNEIYRIIDIDENGINSIFIFNYSDTNINSKELINKEYLSEKKYLIGERNYESIKDKDIPIYLVNMNVFKDDTIDVIKRKIIHAFDKNISFDEIYLFGLREEIINNFDIFQILSQNDNLEINNERMFQYLQNFLDIDISTLDLDKETFSFDDIILLDLDNKTKIKKFPIGNRYFIEKNYPLVINPFDIINFDDFLNKQAGDIVSTQNNALLLEFSNIYENNIYLCLAEKVLKYAIENEYSEKNMIKLYYPFLNEKQIENREQLNKNKTGLLQNNNKLLDKFFYKNNNNVNLLYDIYNKRKSDLEYIHSGVKEISFTINPQYNIILPLELVFKLVKTNKQIPFIKYNPGKGLEKIYRIYANKISTNGKKIPYLSKASINKLRSSMATEKSIEIYIEIPDGKSFLTVMFNEQGQTTCNFKTEEFKNIDELNEIFKEYVNNIINIIRDYLQQRGYNFTNFLSLENENITINKINYNLYLSIERNIKFSKYIGCLSSFVNIINDNLRDGITLRYKKVSYFNKMESIDAFITEMILQNKPENIIIDELQNNFKLSEKEANDKFIEWLSNIKVEQQIYQNRKLKIKSNPGFPITILKDKFTNKISITIDNINNLKYLSILPFYIDSMIRLTQDIDSTNVNRIEINKLCGSKEIVEKTKIVDLESKIEDNLQSNIGFEFIGNEIKDVELTDDEEGLMGLLEEGEDDFEMTGGANSNDDDSDGFIELEEGSVTPSKSKSKTKSKTPVEDDDDETEEELELEESSVTPSKSKSKTKSKTPVEDDDDTEEELELEEDSVTPSKSKSKTKSKTPVEDDDTEEESILELSEGSELISDKEPKSKSKSKSKSKTQEEIKEDVLTDIDGMPLTNPNYFFERMKARDPVLFLTKKDGKFNAYSRICPSNLRRQPVILTDKEKEKIDKESPGSYDHALKYGSTKDNEFWYICPRYWCLKTNTSMTEEEVKSGKCGKIIPRNAKKVPKGAYVYEFSADAEHKDEEGNYITHNPGFQKTSAHPDGLCIPCCFKNWDSESQRERRAICEGKKEKKEKKQELDDYIKGIDKFPLSKDRWGELPLSIQKILHTDNKKCFEEGYRNIKPFTRCMLRKGIEVNKNQSFISLLADIYPEFHKDVLEVPSLKKMKKIIINSLHLDLFISYFSGSLVSLFEKDSLSVNIHKYKDTTIYKKLNLSEKDEVNYLKRIISSYENFIDYLNDDEVIIDHTFLWDIVSKKNKKLFPQGLNLAILEIPDTDITDNVEIICPTNNYSNEIYSSKKPTIIVIKKDEFYEPVYMYRDEETQIVVHKYYSPFNSHLMSNLKNILQLIRQSYEECQPKKSKPQVYKFDLNKELIEIIKILKSKSFEVTTQIVNYNNKVIGIIIQNKETNGYIPIKPSSIIEDIEYKFMDDDGIWKDMSETYEFLNKIKRLFPELPVKPIVKVLDDGKVVGFLTESNQFISFDSPQDNIGYDDVKILQDGLNYMISDKETLLQNKEDTKRIEIVKKIKLESNFYNAFRNNARILLNKFENMAKRNNIRSILDNLHFQYTEKLEKLIFELRELLNEHVIFSNEMSKNKELLLLIENVTSCLDSKCAEKQYCLSIENKDTCKLILPGKHLISNNNNIEIYYYRLADELIRYGIVKNFIMKPQVYLSIDKLDYDLQKDEIILLDTILTSGYFDDLNEMYQNKYITNSVMEFIQPLQSQKYNFEMTEQYIMDKKRKVPDKKKMVCISKETKVLGVWKRHFHDNYYEKEYLNTPNCSFELLINIIEDFTKKIITVNELKEIIVKKLQELVLLYGEDKILRMILKDQGKEILVRQVLEKKITIENMVLSENYYITNMDIMIIGMHFEAPIVIITGTKLKELMRWKINGIKEPVIETNENRTENSKKQKKAWLVTTKPSSFYYFIKQPGIKRNQIPKYKIISTKDNLSIKKDDMKKSLKRELSFYKWRPSFEKFIENYINIFVKSKRKIKLKDKDIDKDTSITKTKKKIIIT